MENLANSFLREIIKQECWDSMSVKGRSVKVTSFVFFFSCFAPVQSLHSYKGPENFYCIVNLVLSLKDTRNLKTDFVTWKFRRRICLILLHTEGKLSNYC